MQRSKYKIQPQCSDSFLWCTLKQSTWHHLSVISESYTWPPAYLCQRTKWHSQGTFRAVSILFPLPI